MRILIATTTVPFIDGGGNQIVDWLAQTLRTRNFNVEVLKIPFFSHFPVMAEQMLAIRLMDVATQDPADLLITLRTPSYLLNHPNKVIWFLHHHRVAYDLWGTEYQDIPNNEEGLAYRKLMMDSDNQAFKEAKKIYSISCDVANRLKKFNQINSAILYPPLLHGERFHSKDYSDYIIYPSRITDHKRQLLAIESMKYTKTNVRLIIAGKSEHGSYFEKIQTCIQENNLQDKVQIINRWISETEKIELIAHSLAGIYIPYFEDYGYVTLEYSHSKKATLTCTDSGGVLEIVKNEENGYICSPDPKELAARMDELFLNKQLAKKLGENAYHKIFELNITWDKVIEGLTT